MTESAVEFKQRRRGALLLALFLTLLLGTGIFCNPFYTKGEPREALVAQEILRSGNWILPLRYGDEIPSKPIFSHWLMALASLPLGQVTETSVRLPAALLGLLAVIYLYWFLSARIATKHALVAAVILGTSIEWYRTAISCRVDMTLAALLTLVFINLFLWEERRLRGFPWVTVLLLGAATLSKGPVALVLSGLVFLLFTLLQRHDLRRIIKALLVVWVPAGLIGFSWYLAAYLQGGDAFVDVFLSENVRRFSGTMKGDRGEHAHSIGYLYGTLFLGFLPWALLALMGCVNWLVGNFYKPIAAVKEIYRRLSGLDRLHRFVWIVVLVTLLFYSVPTSKRSVYLLPLYPFLAILLADHLEALVRNYSRVLVWYGGALLLIIGTAACLVILTLGDLVDPTLFLRREREILDFLYFKSVLIQAGLNSGIVNASILGLLALSWFYLLHSCVFTKLARIFRGTTLLLGVVLIFANISIMPPITQSLSGRQFAKEVEPLVRESSCVYTFAARFYDLAFYLDNRLALVDDQYALPSGCLVFAERSREAELRSRLGSDRDLVKLRESSNGLSQPRVRVALYRVL